MESCIVDNFVNFRKKLRAELGKAFTELDADECNDIVPNKEEVTVVKIYTNAGDNAYIYCVKKVPVLFEIDKQKVLYPTGMNSA